MGNDLLLSSATASAPEQNYATSPTMRTNKGEAIIQSCFTELAKYSEPSMINITDIWNSGFKDDGNNFYGEHTQYCNLYGAAAKQYGAAIKTSDNSLMSQALSSVTKATQIAVTGLKLLISKEVQFKSQNNIADNVGSKSKNVDNKTAGIAEQETNPEEDINHSDGVFTKIGKTIKSFFNKIFG